MYTSATGMIYIIALVSFLIPLLNYSFSFLRPVHIFIPSVLPQKTLEDWGCVFWFTISWGKPFGKPTGTNGFFHICPSQALARNSKWPRWVRPEIVGEQSLSGGRTNVNGLANPGWFSFLWFPQIVSHGYWNGTPNFNSLVRFINPFGWHDQDFYQQSVIISTKYQRWISIFDRNLHILLVKTPS